MAKQKLIKGRYMNIVLLALAFLMTIIITFTVTVAWFFDGDWASNDITLGGKVSIFLTDGTTGSDGKYTQLYGKNQLHFKLYETEEQKANPDYEPLGYPGQTIDVRASVYNDGDSECYVRARFLVATNITDTHLDLSSLYVYLEQLIEAINKDSKYQYCWQYHEQDADDAILFEGKYWLNNVQYTEAEWTGLKAEQKCDGGYYYLCKKVSNATSQVLLPMKTSSLNTFLMDGTFIIPWQLDNDSAGLKLYAAIQFDAIQTYIPIVYNKNAQAGDKEYTALSSLYGTISKDVNNQMPPELVEIDTYSAQAVWNSCDFGDMDSTWVDSGFKVQTKPTTSIINPPAGS